MTQYLKKSDLTDKISINESEQEHICENNMLNQSNEEIKEDNTSLKSYKLTSKLLNKPKFFNEINNKGKNKETSLTFQNYLLFILCQTLNCFIFNTIQEQVFDDEQINTTSYQIAIPISFLIILFMPTIIYKIMPQYLFFFLQIPQVILLSLLLHDSKIQQSDYFKQFLIQVIIFITNYMNLLYQFLYLERLYKNLLLENNNFKYNVGEYIKYQSLILLGRFLSDLFMVFTNYKKDKLIQAVYIPFSLSIASLILSIFIKKFEFEYQNKLTFKQCVKFQYKNCTNQKYRLLILSCIAFQLITGLTSIILKSTIKNNFDFQNSQQSYTQLMTLYSLFFFISVFSVSVFFIDKVKSQDLVVQTLILFTILINIIHFILIDEQNQENQSIVAIALTTAFSGFLRGFFFALIMKVYIKRSDGNIEIVNFSIWLSYLFNQQFLKSLQSNNLQIFIYILFGFQFIMMFLVIWQKNYYDIVKDPDFIEMSMDETIEKFGLTKQQFSIRYKFVKTIWEGSESSVSIYFDKLLKKEIAVKIVISNNQNMFQNQKKELELLQKLQGIPHIIHVNKYVICQEDLHTFQIFLVMEKADGTLLDQIKQRKKFNKHFTNEEIIILFKSMINTFTLIKQKIGVQHRDIKPQNILFIKKNWYISDFGVSKLMKKNNNSFHQKVQNQQQTIKDYDNQLTITGTPNYMDPQLIQLYKNNENLLLQDNGFDYFKSDVFSLGLVFLQACSLQNIQNLNKNQIILYDQIMKVENKKIYDGILMQVLSKMLQWEQSKRPHFEEINQMLKNADYLK